MPQLLGDQLLKKWLRKKVIVPGTINGMAGYKDKDGNLYSLNVKNAKSK